MAIGAGSTTAQTMSAAMPGRASRPVHSQTGREAGWTYKTSEEDCVWGHNEMSHLQTSVGVDAYLAYSYFSQYYDDCATNWHRPGGNIRLRATWVANGSTCLTSGLVYTQESATGAYIDGWASDITAACGYKNVQVRGYGQVQNGGWHGGWVYGPSHNYGA